MLFILVWQGITIPLFSFLRYISQKDEKLSGYSITLQGKTLTLDHPECQQFETYVFLAKIKLQIWIKWKLKLRVFWSGGFFCYCCDSYSGRYDPGRECYTIIIIQFKYAEGKEVPYRGVQIYEIEKITKILVDFRHYIKYFTKGISHGFLH